MYMKILNYFSQMRGWPHAVASPNHDATLFLVPLAPLRLRQKRALQGEGQAEGFSHSIGMAMTLGHRSMAPREDVYRRERREVVEG